MARTIRIGDIGDYANNQMEKLLRAAVLETDSLLKQASPVDTGRFRASWQVGENAAGSYDAGPQQEPSNADRSRTSAPAAPMYPLRKMNYQQERRQRLQRPQQPAICRKTSQWQVGKGGSKQTGGPGGCKASLKTCKVECEKQPHDIGRRNS
jgi:hypothetical protein